MRRDAEGRKGSVHRLLEHGLQQLCWLHQGLSVAAPLAQTIATRQANRLQTTKRPGDPGFPIEQTEELAPDWHRALVQQLFKASRVDFREAPLHQHHELTLAPGNPALA